MTRSMAKAPKFDGMDRLSNLPGGVMKCIMEFLPVRDAARTCVLSTKWRNVWADHPSLVLDTGFWKDLELYKSPKNTNKANNTIIVGSILLHHVGLIRKFAIDVSFVRSINVDLWLSHICKRSLNVLDLKNSDHGHPYDVPSCVLLNPELTHVSLSVCFIKEIVGCFTNIQILHLEDVWVESNILKTPLLTSLTMKRCECESRFEISAPRLVYLTLEENSHLKLKTFFTCTDINQAFLLKDGVKGDGKEFVELLAAWPKISVLVVNKSRFELSAAGSILDNDILAQNLRCFVVQDVKFHWKSTMAWILYILKNSPLLRTFEIRFGACVINDNMFDKDELLMIPFKTDQLHTVKMKGFYASCNQVLFVKFLLNCAPLLRKLLVEENEKIDSNQRMRILKELLSLQRINPNTEIIFAPNLVPV